MRFHASCPREEEGKPVFFGAMIDREQFSGIQKMECLDFNVTLSAGVLK
jgi:hypothetical protein